MQALQPTLLDPAFQALDVSRRLCGRSLVEFLCRIRINASAYSERRQLGCRGCPSPLHLAAPSPGSGGAASTPGPASASADQRWNSPSGLAYPCVCSSTRSAWFLSARHHIRKIHDPVKRLTLRPVSSSGEGLAAWPATAHTVHEPENLCISREVAPSVPGNIGINAVHQHSSCWPYAGPCDPNIIQTPPLFDTGSCQSYVLQRTVYSMLVCGAATKEGLRTVRSEGWPVFHGTPHYKYS